MLPPNTTRSKGADIFALIISFSKSEFPFFSDTNCTLTFTKQNIFTKRFPHESCAKMILMIELQPFRAFYLLAIFRYKNHQIRNANSSSFRWLPGYDLSTQGIAEGLWVFLSCSVEARVFVQTSWKPYSLLEEVRAKDFLEKTHDALTGHI